MVLVFARRFDSFRGTAESLLSLAPIIPVSSASPPTPSAKQPVPIAAALRRVFAKGYHAADLRADILAGIVVGIVALPLSMALAIANAIESGSATMPKIGRAH